MTAPEDSPGDHIGPPSIQVYYSPDGQFVVLELNGLQIPMEPEDACALAVSLRTSAQYALKAPWRDCLWLDCQHPAEDGPCCARHWPNVPEKLKKQLLAAPAEDRRLAAGAFVQWMTDPRGWKGGGGFTFYRTGRVLFDADGNIAPDIAPEELAAHLWFHETRTAYRPAGLPLMGVRQDISYCLLFESFDRPLALSEEALRALPEGPKVIYASSCPLDADTLAAHDAAFREIPRRLEIWRPKTPARKQLRAAA